MAINNVVGQIIVTRHVESKKEQGKTDLTRGITPEGYDQAKQLGKYIIEHYITGDIKITAVGSGMERSRRSLDGIAEGLSKDLEIKDRVELSAVEFEIPAVIVDGAKLGYGGKGDKIAYIAKEHKDGRKVQAYNQDVQNIGNGYFVFLHDMIERMHENECIITSGHGPSERSHLIQLADNLRNRETADRIYDFLIKNGGTEKGWISCSYLVTRNREVYLILGDKDSRPLEVEVETIKKLADMYDNEKHKRNIEQAKQEVY
ncbi:hypothetical protein KY343_05975 [Candidatus Woesearchaeota archaeon]|nr:hypothetical protein [Candidatus Woesearchaeota archaeon]